MTLIPPIETPAASKLTRDDFIYISAIGKPADFIGDMYGYVNYGPNPDIGKTYTVYIADCFDKGQTIVTYRNIVMGDSLAKVQKAYGKAKKHKFINTESTYIREQDHNPAYHLHTWKYYLEYRYTTEFKDKICLRFYFNNKDRVCAIGAQPVKLDRLYSKVFFKSGIEIKVPEGKKLTTKKIDGKKVYMIPADSTIIFHKENSNVRNIQAAPYDDDLIEIQSSVYDKDNYAFAHVDYQNLIYFNIKFNETYKVKDLFGKMCRSDKDEKISYKKFGDYKFIVMKVLPYYNAYDYFFEAEERMIPEYIYFKIVD